jgi:hypothetical protein
MDNITVNITEIPEEITVQVSSIGEQGPNGLNGNLSEIVASESLTAFSVVNGDGTKSDSTNILKRGQAIGIVTENINSGFSGEVVLFGEITNNSWNFTAGQILYLNGTTISATAPSTGFIQRLGVAITSIKIDLQIQQTILI